MRLAATGDIHYTRASHGTLQPLCAQITESADVLLLCGDIIDYGFPEEARLFTKELTTAVKIPILAVLGNHEYESGKQDEVQQIFADAGILTSTEPAADAFYRRGLVTLSEGHIPFLVGGGHAFERYTGIVRRTKDCDIFVYPRDCDRALQALSTAGYRTDLTFPHWLGKAFCKDTL